MSSVGDSHAKTLAWQGGGQGSTKTPAADYGQSTPVLLAKYDPNSSSWRTSQLCLEGGLTAFSETWPRSGMMRSGTAYQLPPLVRLTDATGSGLWQTPVANDSVNRKNGNYNSRGEPKLSAQVKLWATPQAGDAKACYTGTQNQVMLAHQVKMFPTQAARDWKDNGTSPAELNRNSVTLATSAGGSLNPTWVEWLMGFPTDHTALNALETPSSRKFQKSSGGQ